MPYLLWGFAEFMAALVTSMLTLAGWITVAVGLTIMLVSLAFFGLHAAWLHLSRTAADRLS